MGRKRFSNDFVSLRGRWRDNKKLVLQILKDTQSGVDWTLRLQKFQVSDSEQVAPLTENYKFPPDLRHFVLEKKNLTGVEIDNANLESTTAFRASGSAIFCSCNLVRSRWQRANICGTKFLNCDLGQASFSGADLSGVDFSGSRLRYASFRRANLQGARFEGTDLHHANLSEAHCDGAVFTGARIYGASLWGLIGTPKEQSNLVITPDDVAEITIDNLKVAQFVYLLLNNREIREVLDTITTKVVLILGRFTELRKPLLDGLRKELRQIDYVPVLFDFKKSESRDTIETLRTLASMAKFVIADLTDAKSVVQELQAIVPDFPSLPVQPLLLETQEEPGMFNHIRRIGQDRVLPTVYYESKDQLFSSLYDLVIVPPHEMARQLRLSNN